jgi:hypothetical protein
LSPQFFLTVESVHPWGERRGGHSPRGQMSPLGAKFTPRGEVKNGPLLFYNVRPFLPIQVYQALMTPEEANPAPPAQRLADVRNLVHHPGVDFMNLFRPKFTDRT